MEGEKLLEPTSKIIYTYKHHNVAAGCRAKLEDPRPVPVRPCREEDRKVELGRSAVAVLYIYNQKGRCGSPGPRRRRPQLTLNCVLALCISLPALRGPDVK